MKYYVILLVTYSNETKDDTSITSFATEGGALKNFYKQMSNYVNGENVATVSVEMKSNLGGAYKNDTWVAPSKE